MARTAPAPNLVAIPGMNPGNIVAGGGGGAGGGSGKGGKGGRGGGGAGTEDGGEDASAGGKDAGECGTGDGAGDCPTHDEHATAGDPVDVATGNVITVPTLDLHLPGHIPVQVVRCYSTAARRRDIGLGFGWTHGFAWTLEVGHRKLKVHTDDGRSVEFPHISEGAEHIGRDGWRLQLTHGQYVLETDDDFRRYFQSGLVNAPLLGVRDRYGNQVALQHSANGLEKIVDSVGREIDVLRDPTGHIERFRVRGGGAVYESPRYRYSPDGDLIETLDPDGYRTTYTYEHHRLTSKVDGNGLRFNFRYDRQGRCVETWGDHIHGDDLGLEQGVTQTLADGSPAKGVHHCKINFEEGFSEVVNSVRIDRVHTNEFGKADLTHAGAVLTNRKFDALGHLVELTDATGATTQWQRDHRGRILEMIGPLGARTRFERNLEGDIIAIDHPNGARTEVIRDAHGGVIAGRRPDGSVVSNARNGQGALVSRIDGTGGRTNLEYNVHSDLTAIVQPSGDRWEYQYDYFGRPTSVVTPSGARHQWSYTAAGRMVQETLPHGGVESRSFGAVGELRQTMNAEGKVTQFDWRGFQQLTACAAPDGGTVHKRYNREGWLTQVFNEKGEQQTYEYDLNGQRTSQQAFDGRVHSYERDELGRLSKYENALGEVTSFLRDAEGRIVERDFADGSTHQFVHDPCGQIIEAKSAAVETRYSRDGSGRIVREEHRIGPRHFTLERTLDGEGRLQTLRTSLGHQVRVKRDVNGNAVETELDGVIVRQERDAEGRELCRRLPGGGEIKSRFDVMGWLQERSVSSAGLAQSPEPEHVGGSQNTANFSYEYSSAGNLKKLVTQTQGTAEFSYDSADRLIETTRDGQTEEAFRYDETGNITAGPGGARRYGAGNRLLSDQSHEYRCNDAGQLVEKRSLDDTATAKTTSYEWDATGMLSAVVLPDGDRIEYQYDYLGRRVIRVHHFAATESQGPRPSKTTYYVWDGLRLLHELVEVADETIQIRTYHHDATHRDPIAVRTVDGPDYSQSPTWRFHVTDHTGAVLQLVAPDGAVCWEQQRRGYSLEPISGANEAPSLFGLAGQQHDQDTGLCYNWFRTYDPALGRYISPDPVELAGGTNVYAYSSQPLLIADLYGLTHFVKGAYILRRDGSTTPVGDFDSRQEGSQYEGVLAQMQQVAGTEDQEASDGLKRQACHTEQKGCYEVAHGDAAHRIEKDDTLVLPGQEPPCNNCKGAMNRLAHKNKCKVEYTWTDDEGIDQKWKTNPQKAAKSSSVKKWVKAGLL